MSEIENEAPAVEPEAADPAAPADAAEPVAPEAPEVEGAEVEVEAEVEAEVNADGLTIPTSRLAGSLEGIIQREINAFVMESFGRFLRPSLLSAIRREHDPQFSEENL